MRLKQTEQNRMASGDITNMRPKLLFLVLLGTVVLSSMDVAAQDIQFRRQRGPYYAGDPIVVQVIVRGVDAGSNVTCNLQGSVPKGVTIEGPQLNRSTRSFTQIINGRVSSHESTDYVFGFTVTAAQEGKFQIGPFEVNFAGKRQTVAAELFAFEKLDNDPDMQIAVSLPGDTFYVGQRVKATVRWTFAGDIDAIQYAFSNLQIRSPLFDLFPFDKQRPRTRTTLTIAMAKGVMEIDAQVAQEKLNDKDCVAITGTATFIADNPGRHNAIPVTCRTEKVVQWGRDLFGSLVARQRSPALASGKPLSFFIRPIPTDNRPASFAGAVGRGFSITASANRSIVRVGDPISLTVAVRGDADLTRISLPSLAASPGWSAAAFQLPDDQAAGTVDGNTKQFTLNVRVKDTSVEQIPAIAFSWFDPQQKKFVTATSKPIALKVMENHVVSAADVIAVPNAAGSAAQRSDSPTQGGTGAGTTRRSFVGANLAIEQNVSALLADASSSASPRTVSIAIYLLAIAVFLGSVGIRRRAQRDPEVARRKRSLHAISKNIDTARLAPPRQAAEQLAASLRQLIAEIAPANRAEVEPMIAECENAIYALDDQGLPDLSATIERAGRLVSEIARAKRV